MDGDFCNGLFLAYFRDKNHFHRLGIKVDNPVDNLLITCVELIHFANSLVGASDPF